MQATRTWRQVRGLLDQLIGRYDEEVVELEIKLKRLEDDVSVGEETMEQLRNRYYTRMYEVLEKYHAAWTAHELLFSLYHDPHSLTLMGFELTDVEDMEIFHILDEEER